jgi:hypothetical protein
MTSIQRAADQHTQQLAGPIVWILSKGEDYEGGRILGVYASKEAAKGPFVEAAASIPFDLNKVWQDDDGSVNATAAATGSPWSRTR